MSFDLNAIPRCRITHLPTPLEKLTRLSRILGGPAIYIKRDDLTGLGLGGNKTRKLEFLLGEAVSRQCDCVITAGAMQSNHCRQTAAAAAAVGLACHLALGGEAPAVAEGNLLLDHLFGATVHWCGDCSNGEQMPEIAEALRTRGHRPYIIPFGGSNEIGAIGFVAAMGELKEQMAAQKIRANYLVMPSSSGGTQAGMVLGRDIHNLELEIIGIGIDRKDSGHPTYESDLARIANRASAALDAGITYEARQFHMRYDFFGSGYAAVGELEREAMHLAGRHEGILLDPVYTARAMGGLIHMIRQQEFSSRDAVVFWHTGGIPAVFSHPEALGGQS